MTLEHENSVPQIPDVEIEKLIGTGGMGAVYKGKQSYLDRTVAVKVLDQYAHNTVYADRFRREAKILASLTHPNIVACFQAGLSAEGTCYILMEYIEGSDLYQYVNQSGPLEERQAAYIIKTIAQALQYAQDKGIIHRDVKPENILLQKITPTDSQTLPIPEFSYIPKLADLGLAKPVEVQSEDKGDNVTKAGTFVGTPANMAIEQFYEPQNVDYRADIYGLGCVFYYILTSKSTHPYQTISKIIYEKSMSPSPNPALLRKNLSSATVSLITDMLHKDRHLRPQSYQEIIQRAQEIIQQTEGKTSGKITMAESPKAYSRRLLVLVGGLLLVVLLLSFIIGWRLISEDSLFVEQETSQVPLPPQKDPVSSPSEQKESPLGEYQEPLLKNHKITNEEETKENSSPTATPSAPKELKWDEVKSLFQDDFFKRLVEWQKKVGPANWGPSEEGEGVFGNGSGRISYPLPAISWRLQGKVQALHPEAREYGIRLEIPDKKALALTIQNIGNVNLISIARLGEDRKPGVAGKRKVLFSQTLPASDHPISFKLFYQRNISPHKITFYLGGEKWQSLDIGKVQKLSLYVRESLGVHFSELTIQYADH